MEQKKKLDHLEKLANLVRYWSLEMSTAAGSGHPSSSLSAVELMTALMFGGVLQFDVNDKDHPTNDRLIFSKGHASPLYYALWAAAGQIDPEHLKTFRDFESDLEGHPTPKFKFTEAATGSLGQGLSIGLGMAIAAKYLDKTDARTFVLLGDSEMAEGSIWEAMGVASYYKCNNLIGIIDVNRLGQRGETMLGHDVDTYRARAESFGWNAVVVDGHNTQEILHAYNDVVGVNEKPTMIVAKTYKGKGVSFIENADGWHGKSLNDEEFEKVKAELGDIDLDLRGDIIAPDVKEITSREEEKGKAVSKEYAIGEMVAVRDAYGTGIVKLMRENDRVIVLDAEVSNSTRAGKATEVFPERFFEMFIAEQNMVGVGLGLARRGYLPYISSFAAFLTRAHGQIRMSRFSDAHMVYIGSHAGVSIGEDGSSQMGLEDLAIFRAILDSVVLYPSDAVSAEKLIAAAAENNAINYIRMTRGATPVLYGAHDEFPIGGSKTIHESAGDRITIVSAGTTLHEALTAHDILKQEGIMTRVIDLYSVKPLDRDALIKAAEETGHILTVEDHYREGGIASAVQEALGARAGVVTALCVTKMPHSGTPAQLLAYEEIDATAIASAVIKILS